MEKKRDRDVPYWYGERALTGLLCAAAWKLKDGWGLVEFLAKRKAKKGPIKSNGSGDLWWGVGDAVDTGFTIEAKFYDESIERSTLIEDIEARLGEAARQLKSLDDKYKWGHPYSVCYVVQCTNREAKIKKCIDRLDKVAKLFASEGCIVAKYSLALSPPEDKDEALFYPGIVLVARKERGLGWR